MIDPRTYDGQIHTIQTTDGADFVAKLAAYREDGFSYCVLGCAPGTFKVQKVMR